jgi:glycosyltransferase involved in cell wall biosynthesis
MAAKKPVVATNVGSINTVIKDRENGLLIENCNKEELAEAIKFLLDNEDRAHKMSVAGQKKILNQYSSQKMRDQYLKIYRGLITKRKKGDSCEKLF